MGKRFCILTLAFISVGCANSLHTVYKHQPISVVDHKTGLNCPLAYSSWDGKYWSDYYSAPCDIYVVDQLAPIYPGDVAK